MSIEQNVREFLQTECRGLFLKFRLIKSTESTCTVEFFNIFGEERDRRLFFYLNSERDLCVRVDVNKQNEQCVIQGLYSDVRFFWIALLVQKHIEVKNKIAV